MNPDLANLIAAEFVQRGMTPAAAQRLAEFVADAAEIIAREKLLEFLSRFKATRAGSALALAFGDEEGVRQAARRLCMSPGALSAMVKSYRREITSGNVATV